jgi:hypothetical protein
MIVSERSSPMNITRLTVKTISLVGAAFFAGVLAASPSACAADRDWAVAGKILTGVVAADLLFNHLPAVTSPVPAQVVETRVYREYRPSSVRIVDEPYVYGPPPRQTIIYQSCPPPPVVQYVPAPVVVYPSCPPPVVHSSISVGFGGYGDRHGHHPWAVTGSRHRSHAW